MSIEKIHKAVAGSHGGGYFGLCCITPLKVSVCNNAPWTSKTSRFCRRHRLDSVRRSCLDRAVLPAHPFARRGVAAVRFAQRNNRYSVSESLEALLYPLILGLGRIETTEPLRHNGVFHYLAGLPGYPEATSLRRFLQRFAQEGRSALLRLHAGAPRCWRSRRERFSIWTAPY